ncbi:two-component sensor histidine kinase [Actinomadura sp. NBRC 104412]|uniref:sensor histidine kinase n=1 Tax=Actinomadura sp. NBRC 104412 TaxID=3032203 RepID=UPI0024A27CA8|nr:histidine kinase [Actinomadura sp. NBRC 104412]GLZ06491.1 two-component sensor histidine kinase [Actinomadura sp. NBRC 104412]
MRADRLSGVLIPDRWRHVTPMTRDVLVAVAALALGCLLLRAGVVHRRPGPVDAAWLVPPLILASGSLSLRRTRPLLGLGLATAAAAADMVAGPSLLPALILANLVYNATLYGTAQAVPWLTGGGHAASGLAALLVLLCTRSPRDTLLTAVCAYLVLVWPSTMGLTVRRHRERAEQARRRIKVACRRSVMRERARVTGDIHDIVCNHLSAIALQSTAAMATAPRDNEKHLTALVGIRRSSLEGVDEVRRMIAALRTGARGPESAPASLDLVRSRIERLESLGSPARLRTVGTPVPLEPDVETAACRIIQESLTNALKHAQGAAVETTVAYLPERLVITVENGLSAAPPDPALGGSGFGLVGMAERAARVGGTCTARRDGDRWRVHAVLPLTPAGRERSELSLSGGSRS